MPVKDGPNFILLRNSWIQVKIKRSLGTINQDGKSNNSFNEEKADQKQDKHSF